MSEQKKEKKYDILSAKDVLTYRRYTVFLFFFSGGDTVLNCAIETLPVKQGSKSFVWVPSVKDM